MLKRLFLSRRRLTVAGLVLAVVAAAVADPALVRAAGLDVWNFPKLEREAEEASSRSHELTVEGGQIQQRIALKEVLITDLIEGRATLAQVTSQFTVLNESRPEYLAAIRTNYPGRTDREKTARNVIEFARTRLDDPVVCNRVIARLEAELAQMTELPAGPPPVAVT